MLTCFGYAFGIADKINIFIIHIKPAASVMHSGLRKILISILKNYNMIYFHNLPTLIYKIVSSRLFCKLL